MEKLCETQINGNTNTVTEKDNPQQDLSEAFRLLNMKQHMNDMSDMKKEILDKRINVLNDDTMSEYLDSIVKKLSIDEIKKLTPHEIEDLYKINNEPIVLDIVLNSPMQVFEFKKDFLIYLKESSEALTQIDAVLKKIDEEMLVHEIELNKLLDEYGDLSTFIRNKMVNDFMNASTENEKNTFKQRLDIFDDALTLNILVDHYKKLSTANTIKDYFARSENIYAKYKKTMRLLGIKSDLVHFNDLEIKFLPKKYHKYPNLFLFSVIKYLAYKTDSAKRLTDGIFISQFTVNLKKLFTNNFNNTEERKIFINAIQTILDLFY